MHGGFGLILMRSIAFLAGNLILDSFCANHNQIWIIISYSILSTELFRIMSFINQKTPQFVNQQTTFNMDACEKEAQVRNNQVMSQYGLEECAKFRSDNRANYMQNLEFTGMYSKRQGDGGGMFIDEESALRLGTHGNTLTSTLKTKDKRGLANQPRMYATVPNMSAGSGTRWGINPDASSILMAGETTRVGKSCDTLSGVDLYSHHVIPLVPCLADNVQRLDHIVPTAWVRGGMSSRNSLANIDYYKACSIRRPLS